MGSSSYVADDILLVPVFEVGFEYYYIIFWYASYHIYLLFDISISDIQLACVGSVHNKNLFTFILFEMSTSCSAENPFQQVSTHID